MTVRNRFDIGELLNDVSLSAAKEYQKIHYSNLIPDEMNPYSMKGIEKLADAIENCGLLQTLVVSSINQNQYRIISGHRRYQALLILIEDRNRKEFAEVPCIVIPAETDQLFQRIMIHVSNTAQRKLSASENLKAVSELKQLYEQCAEKGIYLKGKLRDQIANDVHMAPRQVQKYLTIVAKADKETLEAISSGEMTVNEAYDQVKSQRNTGQDDYQNTIIKMRNLLKEMNHLNGIICSCQIDLYLKAIEKELVLYQSGNSL